MLLDATAARWLTLHGLVTVLAVLLYAITSHVMNQRRHPAAAIAWMFFILLLPYVALPAFLAFGSRKLPRPRHAAPSELHASAGDSGWASETIAALGQPAAAAYTALAVHADGRAAREALFAAIDSAQHTIDLCTFILAHDALGDAVLERLCAQARRGVQVRLLLDGLGHWMARRPHLQPLVDAGGAWTLFVPPLSSPLKGRTNLRDHRKMLIVDSGTEAGRLWCGGRNLASEYFVGDGVEVEGAAPAPWRDLSFDLRGPLVAQAGALFEHDWAFARHQPAPLVNAANTAMASAPTRGGAQIVASGPDQIDDTLHALLVTAAYRARHSIRLVTPYFVPEAALLMALCLAARRGVRVDLLIPARSNHRLSDLARSRALRALARAGGRIWLAPGMLHAKLVVIDDDTLALAGSANLDSRSLFLNYELMVAFHEAADVRRFAAWCEAERLTAAPYIPSAPGLVRDVAEGMLLLLGFQL